MNVASLEIDLVSIDARWVVVGFGVAQIMDSLPALLHRLGPKSTCFPKTTTLLGVPRPSALDTSAYILVVDHDDDVGRADAQKFACDISRGERLKVLISVGKPSRSPPVPDGVLHVSLPEPEGAEWVVASLLMGVTSNGLIGIDFSDIRDCLHAAEPARAWLWQGRSGQAVADTARDLARAAAEAGIPPTGIAGVTVMTVVPPAWTLNDMVELSSGLSLPEDVYRALAAFTDHGLSPVTVAVVFTNSSMPGG